MPDTIAGASVLGFIPTSYPAGIALLEDWDDDASRIVWRTVSVADITYPVPSEVETFTELEAARQSLVARASHV